MNNVKTNSISKFCLCLILAIIIGLAFGTSTFYATKNPTINMTKASVYVGNSIKLKVSNANKTVKWSTSNSSIAKITKKSGSKSCKATIKGLKKGSATITAKVGKKKLKCKITVKNKPTTSSTVYVTPSGKKYHRIKNCSTLSRSKIINAVTITWAKQHKYGACKVCY